VQIPSFRTCLVVWCLLSSAALAQNTSQSDQAGPEQSAASSPDLVRSSNVNNFETGSERPDVTLALRPIALTDLSVPSGSLNAALPAEATPSPADAQSQGNGKVSGGGNPAALPATTPYVFPTNRQMGGYWVRNVLGPKAFVGATLTASWNTWVNLSPDEWGHRRGWGKRFGVSFLDNSMNETARTSLSVAMNQDPMYYRCECSGAWARTKHAFKLSFMSRKSSGAYVFAPPKIIAPFVGPLVTRNTIYPSSFDSSNAASAGAYYLAGSVGWNLFREFVFLWKWH
jgi:hypothetical protein